MKIKTEFKIRLFVFLVSFAIFFGGNYNVYLSYERFYNPDTETYMNIAGGNFKNQSLIRRYRVVVPFLAKAVSESLRPFYYKIFKEHREKFDWILITGFYIVNSIFLALAALIIFVIGEKYRLSTMAQIISLLAFIVGGRWQGLMAAHPMVDSLYVLVIAVLILGIQRQNLLLIGSAIIIGPFSKESFLFFIPLIFLYTGKLRLKSVLLLVFSYSFHLFCRHLIDIQDSTSMAASVLTDSTHFDFIIISIHKFLSVKGWGEMFSVYGFFTLIIIWCFTKKQFYNYLYTRINFYYILFAGIMIVHAVLSSEISRMFYAGSALFIPFMGKCYEYIIKPANTNHGLTPGADSLHLHKKRKTFVPTQ